MKILHCIGFYDERYLYREQYYTQALAENAEDDVYVLTSTRGQPHSPVKQNFPVGESRHGKVTVIRQQPYFQYKDMVLFPFKEIIDRIKPDLVHVYEFRQWITYQVARYCVKQSIPVVYEHEQRSEGLTPLGIIRSRLTVNRWLKEMIPALATLRSATPGAAEYVMKCARDRQAQVSLCTLGFNKAFFFRDAALREQLRATWGIGPDEILIGTTGKFDSSKHIDLLIEAYAKSSNTRLRLALIGKASAAYDAALRSAIERTRKPILYFDEMQSRSALNGTFNMLDYAIWTAPTISYFEAVGTGLRIIVPRGSGTSHLNSELIQFYGSSRSIDEHNKIGDRPAVLAEIVSILNQLDGYPRSDHNDSRKFEITSIVKELHEQYRNALQH